MLSRAEPACLVIADISGYTSYLAGVELDHAQDILADLVDTVVGALRPTFRLAKLEGDAAFVYAITGTVDGSALQDQVEGCYFAFRRRLRDIRQASSCECNACILIPRLDLKLVAHHGSIVRQRMAGHEELVGSDVIVIHRLLKNSVVETLGVTAYALYTEACIRAMGIDDPSASGLREHRETYDVIGEVVGWVRDLGAAWRAELDRRRVIVEAKDAMWEYSRELPGPPSLVWDYLTSPIRRLRWQAGVTAVVEETAGNRRGVGTTNHCIHGRDAIVEEIVDWRPPAYLTMRFQVPVPGAPKMTMTELLEPLQDGSTRLTVRLQRLRGAKDLAAFESLKEMLAGALTAGHAALEPLLAEAVAERAGAVDEPPEPALPEGAARYLEPVAG
jgi:uncharacterized protein YndB with AHSA1/START domain